jgi:type I restriction enzyme S subunit
MKRIPVLIPPPDEQDSIARYLDEMDRRITRFIFNRQRLIKVLNEQKQAIINRAVTRGLDPNTPLKPSGIDWLGNFPKHWGRRRIKQVSKLLRGKFTHRPRNDPSLYDGPYPFIQTGDVSRAEKKVVSYSQTLNENGFAVSKQFPPGTLCMTIAANIGDVAILDFEACFPDSIIGLAPNKGISTEYLYYAMQAMKPQLVSIAPVTAQGNLNVERVGAMSFVLPPIYEQEAIVEYIAEATRSIEYTIKTATREINLIREYRTRLISDVVTGKIDVRHLVPSLGSEDLEKAAEALEPLEDAMADVEMDDKEDFNESD